MSRLVARNGTNQQTTRAKTPFKPDIDTHYWIGTIIIEDLVYFTLRGGSVNLFVSSHPHPPLALKALHMYA